MKPSEIISLARRQTGCTEDIVTVQEAYHFLNFVIEDFGADIRNSDSGYGYDVLQIPVTAGQAQYTFTGTPGIMSDKFPMHKIQAVWIKRQDGKRGDLPVHFVDKVDINRLTELKEPLACFITRTELNLIPAPKYSTELEIWGFDYNTEVKFHQSITVNDGGVDYTYIRAENLDQPGEDHPYAWHISDQSVTTWYTINEYPVVGDILYELPTGGVDNYTIIATGQAFDDENEIFIPARWHYILVEGLKYWMYGNMGVNFEAARTNSRNFYDSEKMKAIQNIVDRGQLADTAYFPDLNYLNY